MSNLMLHCGATKATLDEVRAVPTPTPTETWFPIPHAQVFEAAQEQILKAGFEVQSSHLALTREGRQFFATLDLTSTVAEGVSLAIGLRNSIDKSLPMGFLAGHRVFVCDNLAFSSELMVIRKHTRHGLARFQESIALAAGRISEFQQLETTRLTRLRELELSDTEADSLILRAYERGIVSHLHLPAVIKEWREPSHAEFEARTRWSLYNAFTEALKVLQRNPQGFASRTFNLNALLSPPNEGPASLRDALNQASAEIADVIEVDAEVL